MRKNLKANLIRLAGVLFFCQAAMAQQVKPTELQSLDKVLNTLTAEYKVNFLYEEVYIRQKQVLYTSEKGKVLKNVLDNLLTPLNLSWLKVDRQNYSIFPLSPKKPETENAAGMWSKSIGKDSTGTDKVNGRVLDEKSEPIPYTAVSLLVAADSVVVVNVLTDLDGYYTFQAVKPGLYKLKISSMGHAPYITNAFTVDGVKPSVIEPIVLQPATQMLKAVTITSNKPLVETKPDRLIYNLDNSAMAAGNSLQVLRSAPFVRVATDNTVSLQGKRTMILIDNKPVPEASLENILQTIPAANIQKIELITRPSVKYDAAYGAVINIITKKSQIEGLTGRLQVDGSTGHYAGGASNASATYKRGILTAYINAGINKADKFFSITSDRYQNPSDPLYRVTNNWSRILHSTIYSFQGSVDLQIDKNQTIGVFADVGDFLFKGPWITTNDFGHKNEKPDSVLFTDATFRQKSGSGTYNLNYHLLSDSGNNELTILATLTPFNRNLFQSFPSTLYDGSGTVLKTPPLYQMRNTSDIKVFITQADYGHQFKDQLKFEAGIKYQHTDSKTSVTYADDRTGSMIVVPGLSNRNNLKETIFSGYSMFTKNWKNDKLQAGVRIENTAADFIGYAKTDYFNFFPTLLYEHTLNEHADLSLSYRATIRRPPYSELVPYTVFLNQYSIEQGNPGLKAQFDHVYTLSTNIQKLNLSLSYTYTNELIGLFPLKQDNITKVTYYSRQNLEKGDDISLYVFYPFKINDWWETQNSGTPFAFNSAEGVVLGQKFKVKGFRSDFQTSHIFKLSKNIKLQVDAYYWTGYAQDLSTYNGNKNVNASFLVNLWEGKGQFRLGGSELVFKRNDYILERTYGAFRTTEQINTDSKRIFFGFNYKFGKSRIQKANTKLGNEDALKRL